MTKLTIVAFSLVTALSGSALAHDGNYRATPVRGIPHEQPVRYYAVPSTPAAPFSVADLRMSDANHDGSVTLREALRAGRADFARSDDNRDGVLSARELSRAGVVQDDRNRDGVVSWAEYQSDVRRSFQVRDTNRDGVLQRRELSLAGPWLNTARGPQRW